MRAVRAFALPMCAGAQVLNAGFRDIDQDANNEWSFSSFGSQMRWETLSFGLSQNANSLKWNSVFNFWFDSDAAPVPGTASLDAYRPGLGASFFGVATTVPAALYNVSMGPGCGSPTPALVATGSPARATLGNGSFGLSCSQLTPSAACWFFMSPTPANVPLGGPGCTLYLGALPGQGLVWFPVNANASGVAALTTPVPNLPILEGGSIYVQVAATASPGAIMGLNLSNGLRIRLGSNIGPCP
jgi:hypothetical protein